MKMSFEMKKKQTIYFKTLPFYVLIEGPENKKLSNIELLHELPCYN